MPRPRVYDLDVVLDAAEALAAQAGPAGVTTRSVATAAGVSNGAIYHNFGSRSELVARTWLRAAGRFLDMQMELVDAVLNAARPGAVDAVVGVDAVVAAADAPVVFAGRWPQSAELLWRVQRDQLLGDDLPADVVAQLGALDKRLLDLMKRLSGALWNRRDRSAVDAITLCIVDLPTSIILSRNRINDKWARSRLSTAVRAVLADGPPTARR